MSDISTALRDAVVQRAGNRCEYCQLAQEGQEATFHIDHVEPRATGGLTVTENLALACVSCSLRKGAKRSGVDPQTGEEVGLFNPRADDWSLHFQWDGSRVVPLSNVGRVTV